MRRRHGGTEQRLYHCTDWCATVVCSVQFGQCLLTVDNGVERIVARLGRQRDGRREGLRFGSGCDDCLCIKRGDGLAFRRDNHHRRAQRQWGITFVAHGHTNRCLTSSHQRLVAQAEVGHDGVGQCLVGRLHPAGTRGIAFGRRGERHHTAVARGVVAAQFHLEGRALLPCGNGYGGRHQEVFVVGTEADGQG